MSTTTVTEATAVPRPRTLRFSFDDVPRDCLGGFCGDPIFRRGVREYLRADFHPGKNPIDHLAAGYLASAGIA